MKGGFTHGERRSPKPEGAVAEGAGVGFDVSLLLLAMETLAAVVMFAVVLVIVGVALDAARRAK